METLSKPLEAGTDVTDDAVLGGKLKLLQPARGHRAGHDAILLAAAAPKSAVALDLGAGAGTAGLALLTRGIASQVTFVEVDPHLSELSAENARRNGFGGKASVVCGDIAESLPIQTDGFDLVLMNPPFTDGETHRASPDEARARAHVGNEETLSLWVSCAVRHLKTNGTLVIIHRPESTLPILKSMEGRFGAIEMIPVFPKPEAAAIRLIVRAIKGRKTPVTLHPGVTLSTTDGKPSDAAERILRAGASIFAEK